MYRFLKTSILLSIPFLIWTLLVVVVDPFNYFGVSSVFSNETKAMNAEKLNSLLYRSVAFKNSPSPNILVGDSRTDLLPTQDIEKKTGKSFRKLTTNAAKLNEIIELVYFANDYQKLKTVVIGINFNMFNEFGYADRVKDVKEMIDMPTRYVFNSSVAETIYYVVRGALTGKNIVDQPPMTREEFWKWNIDEKATHWYGKYKYPTQLYSDILKLDDFAVNNDITLIFVVVPHHIEFHDRLIDYGLGNEELKFKDFLRGLKSPVIDYDYKNVITTNKENFSDPVHYNEHIGTLIVNEIWGESMVIGKKLD